MSIKKIQSLISFQVVAAWGVGLVIGPALGGYLAQVRKLMLEIQFKLGIGFETLLQYLNKDS